MGSRITLEDTTMYIPLRNLANNYKALFRQKPLPKVRHIRTKKNVGSVVFSGTAVGSTGLYTMDVELEKDNVGNVSYLSPVSYIKCSCPAFQFYVQDPLAKIYSTNPATGYPNKKINNPKQIAAPCKHLYAYIQLLMDKGIIVKANTGRR